MAKKPVNLPMLHAHDISGPLETLRRELHDQDKCCGTKAESRDAAAQFSEAVNEIAERAGCRFLFELPPILLGDGVDKIEDAERVAAVLCPDADSCNVIFIVLHTSARNIMVLETQDVPERIVDFAFSFAEVMRQLSPFPACYSAGDSMAVLH